MRPDLVLIGEESAVIADAQRRLDARRAAWMREKSLLDRTDWIFAPKPAAPEGGSK